nr:hypothetical protein [Chamaesiphon sp. OTE_75_metabat_556]
MAAMIYLENITKTYHLGEIDVPVLKHIDLSILLTERLRQRVRRICGNYGGFGFGQIDPNEHYRLSRSRSVGLSRIAPVVVYISSMAQISPP